jgi:hypothetical protein
MLIRAIFVLGALEIAAGSVSAGTFSRSAMTVQLMWCDSGKCPAVVDVRSPDGTKRIRRTLVRNSFRWDKDGLDHSIDVNLPKVEVVTQNGHWDLPLGTSTDPWVEADVLWSPNSNFVALTGNINGYTESTRVFAITESGPRDLDATLQPGKDMARRLAPYCDRYVGKLSCNANLGADDFNFAAVAWADNRTLVIMSEVPCDTNQGGIMCQVMGYEVDLPSGKIVRAMTPQEFKSRWQHSMAWNFRIPPKLPDWK